MDPNEALAQLPDAVKNGLTAERIPILRRTLIEAAQRKDAQEERHIKANQEAIFRVADRMAQNGTLTNDKVTDLVNDGSINPTHASVLRSQIGRPGALQAPGVADQVFDKARQGNWNPGAIQQTRKELRDLAAKYPRDMTIRQKMDELDAKERLIRAQSNTDRERAWQNYELRLLRTPLGNSTVEKSYVTGPAAQNPIKKSRYREARDQMHFEILQGADPQKSYENAMKALQPQQTGGPNPLDEIHNAIGE
jgi:hypothetical protein